MKREGRLVLFIISFYSRIMLLINEFKNDEVLSLEINDYGLTIPSFVEGKLLEVK